MTWNHQVYRLDERTTDRADRFGVTCATGKCQDPPTHATSWDYVTGRRGRVADSTRYVCTGHAQNFARKHDLQIGPTQPDRLSAVTAALTAMTGGTVVRVRVHNHRGAMWHLQQHEQGQSFPSNRRLGGVPGDATLQQAITEAEFEMAITARLVPAGPWRLGDDNTADVDVVEAQRTEDWHENPWELAVACGPDGMWTLTRVLAPQFGPIVDELGNHNMNLDRALRVATALLAEQGWVTFSDRWSTFDDDTAEQGAWHPDQVGQAPRQAELKGPS